MRDGGVKGDGAVSSLGDCRKGDILSQNKNQRLPASGTQEFVELKTARALRRIRLSIIS